MTESDVRPGRTAVWVGWSAAIILAVCWIDAVSPSWRVGPDLAHGWAVPWLMAYLWWERWAERPPPRALHSVPRGLWLALIVGGAALALVRLVLTPYPLWPAALLLYCALVAATAMATAWVWSGYAGVRWVAGPLLLMIPCIPVPSVLENGLLLPLREIIAGAVAEVCNLLGRPALASGTSVRLAHAWIGIEEACSGIRSLNAALLFSLFFGEWFRFAWARRLLLVGASLAVAVAGNFARVFFLSWYVGGGGALEKVHDPAGWISMVASFLVTAWLAAWWGGFRLPTARPTPSRARAGQPACGWIAMAAAVVLGGAGFAHLWFSPAAVDGSVPQWTARFPTHRSSFHAEPLATTAREMLQPDRFIAGRWRDAQDRDVEAYFVEWTKGQVARSVPFLHNPAVCLPYAGCELVATLPPIDVSTAAGPVRFFTYQFRRTGQPLLVAFTIWDPARGRLLDRPEPHRTWRNWLATQWRDVRERRRDQPAQLLAVSLPTDAAGRSDLERVLRSVVVSQSVVLPGTN